MSSNILSNIFGAFNQLLSVESTLPNQGNLVGLKFQGELTPLGSVNAIGNFDPSTGLIRLRLSPTAGGTQSWDLTLEGADDTWNYEISPVPPDYNGTGTVQFVLEQGGDMNNPMRFLPPGD